MGDILRGMPKGIQKLAATATFGILGYLIGRTETISQIKIQLGPYVLDGSMAGMAVGVVIGAAASYYAMKSV